MAGKEREHCEDCGELLELDGSCLGATHGLTEIQTGIGPDDDLDLEEPYDLDLGDA